MVFGFRSGARVNENTPHEPWNNPSLTVAHLQHPIFPLRSRRPLASHQFRSSALLNALRSSQRFLPVCLFANVPKSSGSPLLALLRLFTGLARRLYRAHLVTLSFAFVLGSFFLSELPGIRNLLDTYLMNPWAAIGGSLALLFRPPLMDILPLYVLGGAMNSGPTGFLIVSRIILSTSAQSSLDSFQPNEGSTE